jgi:hypothetical protein
MYSFFPKTTLQLDDVGNTIRLVDITKTVRLKEFVKSFRGTYGYPYVVQNGERPDIVANRLYGNPKYEYIILMVNDIESVYDQWPKDSTTLRNYIIEKYGSIGAANAIRTWQNGAGDIVSEEFWLNLNDPKKYRESFYQYEVRLNDNRAFIKAIEFPLIIKFESDLQELLSS